MMDIEFDHIDFVMTCHDLIGDMNFESHPTSPFTAAVVTLDKTVYLYWKVLQNGRNLCLRHAFLVAMKPEIIKKFK